MEKRTHNRHDGWPHNPLAAIAVIPQAALRADARRLRRLRLLLALLVLFCTALAAFGLAGQRALSQAGRLAEQARAKDTLIAQLQQENRRLAGELAFQRQVDDLVARIEQVAPWLEHRLIRAAAIEAVSHTSDPALYLAIGLVEAELRADVVHADGVALGMHGLCPKDWHTYLKAKGIMDKRADYFDPVKSFKGSEAVLSALLREYGTLEKALLFYNGGEPAAAGMIPQSRAYVRRVLRLREALAAALAAPGASPS